MAISATTGTANSNGSAVASLALSSFTLTVGQTVVVAVALGSTVSSVSSITDTKGNTYIKQAAQNGTGVRTEIWTSLSVAAQVGNIITVNITGGNTSCAAAAEEYAGVTAIGSNSTVNGGASTSTGIYEYTLAVTQNGAFIVGALGFTCVSGDTLTATSGTSRQSSIPAATAVGIALYDSTATQIGQPRLGTRISTARNWAVAATEIKSGGTAQTATDYHAGTTGLDVHPLCLSNTLLSNASRVLPIVYAGVPGYAQTYFSFAAPYQVIPFATSALFVQLPVSGQLFPPSFPPSSNSYS